MCTGLTLSQPAPRRPASYGAVSDLTTTPSCPRASASSRNASRLRGVAGDEPRHAQAPAGSDRLDCGQPLARRQVERGRRPSRCRTSKKNGVSGTLVRSVSTSPRLAARLAVSWNGRGRPSGRSAIASPSRMTERSGSARTASTISGIRSPTSSRVRVNTATSSPLAVHLDAHAVELPLDGRRIDQPKRGLERLRRLREHRLHGAADSQLERGRARRRPPSARPRRPPAGRRRASPRVAPRTGVDLGGRGDRVRDDAGERSLAQLAPCQHREEALLVRGGAREQGHELLAPHGGGAGAARGLDACERPVDVGDLQCGACRQGRQVAQGTPSRPPRDAGAARRTGS